MTKQKRWSMIMTLLTCWTPLVMMSHNPILFSAWFIAMGTTLGINMHYYIKGDPEQEKERRLQRSRERTAQLESELGLEPLKLEELDEILLNNDHPGKGSDGA